MGEIIALDAAARKKILAGARLIARSLRGKVLICRKEGPIRIANDWRDILRAVFSKDPLEMLAIKLIRENALSLEAASLVAELLEEGLEGLVQGKSLSDIKASLQQREEKPYQTTFVLKGGYLSPYFVNRPEEMQVELIGPYLYVAKEKLKEPLEVAKILEQKKGPLLILAEEISEDVLTTLVINCVKRSLPLAAAAITKQERFLLQSGKIEKAVLEKEKTILTGIVLQSVIQNSLSMTHTLLSMESVVIRT